MRLGADEPSVQQHTPFIPSPQTCTYSYRDRDTETPDLTSTSRSSLTSGSSSHQPNSSLYTQPHSPSTTSFVQTEISNPQSSTTYQPSRTPEHRESLASRSLVPTSNGVKKYADDHEDRAIGSTSNRARESGEYGQEHHHPLDINNATRTPSLVA